MRGKMKSFTSMSMYNLRKVGKMKLFTLHQNLQNKFCFSYTLHFFQILIHLLLMLLPTRFIPSLAHLQIMIRTKDTIKLSHISRVCSLVAIHSLYEASSSTAAALIESLHETNGTRDVNLATPSFMGETRQNGPSY